MKNNKLNARDKSCESMLKKYIDLSIKCFEKHEELMNSLASVKPINNNNTKKK